MAVIQDKRWKQQIFLFVFLSIYTKKKKTHALNEKENDDKHN